MNSSFRMCISLTSICVLNSHFIADGDATICVLRYYTCHHDNYCVGSNSFVHRQDTSKELTVEMAKR